jgi:hypothetical protein
MERVMTLRMNTLSKTWIRDGCWPESMVGVGELANRHIIRDTVVW